MKATSIFGGVQVFNIIIQLIRSKAVAVLLGPAGMGIMGLLTSTISLISSATNFGLGTSAVRDISSANNSGDSHKINETVSVFRKLVWITGTLGLLITIILSPILSKLTFGNSEYTFAFIAVSITLLVNQLAGGQRVLLQGLRKIKWLAQSTIYGSVASLLVSLPMYYIWGTSGIVPAIILSALISLLIQLFFVRKIEVKKIHFTFKEALVKGNSMLKLGLMLSLSGLISVGVSYIIRIFISHFGGVEIVGLYSAGFTIINVYVGMVFTAMATDYYPRLAAVHQDKEKHNKLINQQSEVALLILSPLICVFLIFINWIVIFLYSYKFLPITGMIHWAVLGIFFKAVSWSIGFLILAKGDSKAFFWNELAANSYLLLFNVIGFYYGGLNGLGISFLLGYFIHFLQISIFARWQYGFQFEKNHIRILALFLFLGILSFLMALTLRGWVLYVSGSLLIFCVGGLSVGLLNRRMALISLIKNKLKK